MSRALNSASALRFVQPSSARPNRSFTCFPVASLNLTEKTVPRGPVRLMTHAPAGITSPLSECPAVARRLSRPRSGRADGNLTLAPGRSWLNHGCRYTNRTHVEPWVERHEWSDHGPTLRSVFLAYDAAEIALGLGIYSTVVSTAVGLLTLYGELFQRIGVKVSEDYLVRARDKWVVFGQRPARTGGTRRRPKQLSPFEPEPRSSAGSCWDSEQGLLVQHEAVSV